MMIEWDRDRLLWQDVILIVVTTICIPVHVSIYPPRIDPQRRRAAKNRGNCPRRAAISRARSQYEIAYGRSTALQNTIILTKGSIPRLGVALYELIGETAPPE